MPTTKVSRSLSEIDSNSFITIFSQSPISTQIFTPKGVSVAANRAWEKLWKIKHDDIKGKYNVLTDPQLKAHKIAPYIRRAFKGEVVEVPSIKYEPQKTVAVKGAVAYRWVSAIAYPIKNNEGKIINVVIQHEDVTERKAAEDRLTESKDLFDTIWSAALDAKVISDREGKVLEVNSAYCRLYGYSREELLGKNFAIIFPPQKRRMVRENYRKTFESKREGGIFESKVTSKTGKEYIVESHYSFIVQHGKRTAMLSVVRDITERKQSLKLIEEERARLTLALEAGNIGVWDWNTKTNELMWTEKVYELHQVPKDRPITLEYFITLIHPDDMVMMQESIAKALRNEAVFCPTFRIITPQGTVRWLNTRAIVFFDAKGRPVRMLGATSDVTEQKRLEEDKNDFISIATHELKTPVTSLKAYAEVLEQKFRRSGDEESAQHLAKMNAQLDRLTSLIGDLLDATKIEGGKLQMQRDLFAFDDLVSEISEELQRTTDRHELIVRDDSRKKVLADRERIGQVLTNLISNAIKYSPHSKKIVITSKATLGEVLVSVRDSGVGIPKAKQEKVFERFYRVSGPDGNTYPGLGLGLYISSEIIKRHGGRIWVTSTPGKGSTFIFSLPVKARIPQGNNH